MVKAKLNIQFYKNPFTQKTHSFVKSHISQMCTIYIVMSSQIISHIIWRKSHDSFSVMMVHRTAKKEENLKKLKKIFLPIVIAKFQLNIMSNFFRLPMAEEIKRKVCQRLQFFLVSLAHHTKT